MLLLIVLVLVGVIAFYHYVQGFFSATLSAMLAVIAAVVALGYYEPLARLIPPKFPEYVDAISLSVLFAVVYIVLKVLFDKYLPGNVQVPLMVDKIGAGVMGLVAGVFSVGVAVIAAQMLPFGAAIGGYTRYETVATGTMKLPNKDDGETYHALKSESFKPSDPQQGLLIPVDDVVVGVVAHVSDGGSLAGDQPLRESHPSLLAELFFDRAGIQAGARHVATPEDISLQGLYSPTVAIPGEESEPARTAPKTLKFASSGGELMIIIRLSLGGGAADIDGAVRFSPAAVRLVSERNIYLPVGTMDYNPKTVVRINRPDDFLLAPSGASVDFVYMLPREAVIKDETKLTGPIRFEKPAFIVAKRRGVINLLTGQEIKREMPPSLEKSVLRKFKVAPPPPTPEVVVQSAAGGAAPADSLFATVVGPKLSSAFVTPIGFNAPVSDAASGAPIAGGKADVRARKLSKIEIDPTEPLANIAKGEPVLSELDVPAGKKLIQITAETKPADRWGWAKKLAQTELADSAGASYKPYGVYAKVRSGEGEDRLVARFDADTPLTAFPESENGPTEIGYIFIVPTGVTISQFRVDGKVAGSQTLQVQ